MSFHQPSVWFLLLLGLLPLLWWSRRGGRGRSTVAFSSIGLLGLAGASWAVRLRWLVTALRDSALAVLIICLARPQTADEHAHVFTEGIAIQMVIDRSGSMLAMDFEIDGRPVSRLEAVKAVVEDFVDGGDTLPGRPDDLIGLITFATWADGMSPLTLDHRYLITAVRQTEVSAIEEDRATAIGDAIALGVERMAGLDTELGGDRRIKSKVMVLLTDGESNAGDIDPITAAKMAEAFDIKIYTIGAGTDRASAPVPMTDPFSGRRAMRRVPVSIDEETLRKIAESTGGRYFRATDADSLQEVYARIDELERTEIQQRRYTDYQELAVESVKLGGVTLPPLLSMAIVILGLQIVLANTRFRTLP